MRCPACASETLQPATTAQGVEVDRCTQCGGVWLDEGEIFNFTPDRLTLARALMQAKPNEKPSERLSPKTGKPMREVPLLGGRLTLDACPDTRGFWLDAGELEKIGEIDRHLAALATRAPAREGSHGPAARAVPRLARLPNLFVQSGLVLGGLYALAALVLIAAAEYYKLPPGLVLGAGFIAVCFQFVLAPFLMDWLLALIFQGTWVTSFDLPPHLAEFVRKTCDEKGLPFPQFGIINDGAPNAFTYGHTPRNARIVLTRGLIDILDPGELEAVVAHEMGHARHWDILLMTIAQLAPLVLYYIYRTMLRSSGGDDRGGAYRLVFVAAAYILYIASEFVVLFFSRVREYHADRFAGQVTGRPNDVSTALVKIAYGLAGQTPKGEAGKEEDRRPGLEAVGAMGIFDAGIAKAFAVASFTGARAGGRAVIDKEALLGAMRWDLWNPWARYYELASTHPLVAKRIGRMSELAAWMGQEPFITFNLWKPESYWDDFLEDLAAMWLPTFMLVALGGAAFYTGEKWLYGLALAMAGVSWLVKLSLLYPRKFFPRTTVSALLRNVKVSGVRGIPCVLAGRVIGRGVPGLIWSEDFIMRDETGIIFLDYSQPLRVWEFLFGLMRWRKLSELDVEVTGWYRRSPVPYVEIQAISTEASRYRCYTFPFLHAAAWAVTLGGIALFALLVGGWF